MGVPRNLFVFWKGSPSVLPELCIRRIRSLHPHWDVRVLSDAEERCPGFERLSVQAQSDWVRVCALAKHGGVWLDATCVCTRPVESWVDMGAERVQGFHAPWQASCLESWAFAAPAAHPLMLAWKRELERAIAVGFEAYQDRARARLAGEPVLDRLPYLTVHACYRIAAKRSNEPARLLLPLPFKYLSDTDWNSDRAIDAMLSGPMPATSPLIKLRGAEKMRLEPFLATAAPGSFACTHIIADSEDVSCDGPFAIGVIATCMSTPRVAIVCAVLLCALVALYCFWDRLGAESAACAAVVVVIGVVAMRLRTA